MWGKIKNFFKWIADHTGISWIARKISSGWKWLFDGKANATQQNTSQQEKSSGNERQGPAQAQSKGTTTPKTLDDEVNPDQPTPPKQPASSNKPNFVQQNTKPGSYLECTDNKLLFITTNENYKVLEAECKNEDQEGKVIPGEFRVFVKCDGENFCFTGSYDSQQDVSDGKKSLSITSIRKQNPQSLVSSDPSEMMYKVGLDENRRFVEITKISKDPFGAKTLEQPNPNVTSHNVTQQTVSNETEVKQASGSTTTDQAPEQPASGSEIASPSGSQSTTADSNEPKSERIEISGERLGLVVNTDREDFIRTSKNPSNSEEYLVYVEHAKGIHRITGANLQFVSAGNKNEFQSFSINSIATQDGKTVSGDPVEMKKMLGLDENKKFIEITEISGTLNQSNTNAIGNNATQQAVSNEEVATESEEFFDAENNRVTQPRSLTTDMVVEQADTPNQPNTPSAVLNKPQGNSIVIPEGAKLEFSPELSDYLLRASLVREMLFCKVVPNSLFTSKKLPLLVHLVLPRHSQIPLLF